MRCYLQHTHKLQRMFLDLCMSQAYGSAGILSSLPPVFRLSLSTTGEPLYVVLEAQMSSTSLTTCRSCSADMSSSAERCPKCGTPKDPSVMAPCRSCGKVLDSDRYASLSISRSTTSLSDIRIVDGTSQPVFSFATREVSHTACPHCGDPKPLFAVDLKLYKRQALVLFIVSAACAVLARFLYASKLDDTSWIFILEVVSGVISLAAAVIFIPTVLSYLTTVASG